MPDYGRSPSGVASATPRRSNIVIWVAGGANLAIAAAKLAAYGATGSAAMLTESLHSLVDTGDQALLLLGAALSARPRDDAHPFGYGMEQFFWSFVVALLIFALGGAVSIYEGVERILNPEPIRAAWISFAVLAVAALFEGTSFVVSVRQYRRVYRRRPSLASIGKSKDPNLFIVLLEDSAALLGLLLAAAGVTASTIFGRLEADGWASIGIGLLLAAVALFLIRETRSLMIGEAASDLVIRAIAEAVESHPAVRVRPIVHTIHLGPEHILVALDADFAEATTGEELKKWIRDVTRSVQAIDPRIKDVLFRARGDKGGGGTSPEA
jgi:cation diffusion facilitator family transporter